MVISTMHQVAPPNVPTAPHGRRPAAWAVLLCLTPFLAGIYALLPTADHARSFAYPMYGVAVAILIAIAVLRHPTRRRAWLLVALAIALLTVGDITYSVIALVDGEVPYPSAADVSYLAGYAVLMLGVLGLLRGRTTASERTTLIDAVIVCTGLLERLLAKGREEIRAALAADST